MKLIFKSITNGIRILCLMYISCTLHAQEVVSSGGDFLENASGSLSLTIGEIATETIVTSGSIITQGFQQSRLTVTKVDEPPGFSFSMKIYPNPTSSSISVTYESSEHQQLNYQIADVEGKVLANGKIRDSGQIIRFEKMAVGIYFLQVTNSDNRIETYKIIKQ